MFFNMEKVILSRQMIKTSKGSPPSDTLFPVAPPQPNTHILPPEGKVVLWDHCRQAPPAGAGLRAPGSRCGCPQGNSDSDSKRRPRAQVWVARCSRLAHLQKRRLWLLHIHIPEPRKLCSSGRRPGPATSLNLSESRLRQTSGQDELLIVALENQLSNLKQPLIAGKTGLPAKQILFSRSLGVGGERQS